MDEWTAWGRRTRRWADLTCSDYTRRAKAWLAWCEATGIRPDRATPEHVEAWLATLHPTPAVRSHAHTAVLAFYDWRVSLRKVKRNPVRDVPRVPVRRTVVRSLDPDDVRLVLKSAEGYGPLWACFTGLMVYAGLRRAEACRLRWVDIEGADAWLRVLGKGGQEGIVPIHDNLRRLIVRHRSNPSSPVWLFPGRDGPISVATATKWLRRILDDAGLPDATPHWLRHSYGRRMVEMGVNVPDVMAALRHQSLSSTTVYTRSRPAHVAAAVARLDF